MKLRRSQYHSTSDGRSGVGNWTDKCGNETRALNSYEKNMVTFRVNALKVEVSLDKQWAR